MIDKLDAEEPLEEGRMTDRYKAQVKKHFEDEIDSTDISHEIAEDGLSFTIVREDGTKLEFNAAGGYTTTKPEELKEDGTVVLKETADDQNYSWMIVKMDSDGVHYYYNSSENTFTSDINDGTRYAEREIIQDDFKEVSKNNDNCYMRKIPDMPGWDPIHEEVTEDWIYLFPELTDEDMEMAKAYGLQYLGKNHGADGSEDNWVLRGAESSLRMFADKYLGYELHPDYLYDEEDFAGDIINESLMGLELDKDDILDWLAEHEQAWADAERHFDDGSMDPTYDVDSPLDEVSVKDLVEWIAEHKQLYDDFHRFFYEDNLDEEFLNFDFNQNPDDDVEGIIQ
jgi:hypothetical protein